MPPNLPLQDVTILDLADEATVLGSRFLAELGADVVRVEHAAGDSVRRRPPFLHDDEGIERSLSHLLYNGGKRSLALDFDRPETWPLLERLLPAIDIVIVPLDKPAGMAAFLAAIPQTHPAVGLVDVVFRRDAPHEVAIDLIATAAGGLIVLNGFSDDPPNYPAGELAYKQASMTAAEAALAMLLAAARGGRDGHVTISLQEAVNWTTLQTANGNLWHWHRQVPDRHNPIAPPAIHKSRDGHWLSFTIHPPHWDRYVSPVRQYVSAPDLDDPEWDDLAYRILQRGRVHDYTEALCAALTLQELVDEGQARGLLVLPLNSMQDLARDPHLLARDFFVDTEHPQLGETVRLPRTAFLSNRYPPTLGPAPTLRQHSEEVLTRFAGLDPAELDALFDAGIVHGPRSATPPAASTAPAASSPTDATVPGIRPLPAPTHPTADPHQPLAGVRILDFCWAIAGPLTTRLLADLGADVIKVESEYRLDPIRYIGTQPEGEMSWNTNAQFNDCNTNKRAMTLNLNTPEGIDIVRRLAATAHVVTSNYTPDRLDRWGIGYDDLIKIRPDIIVANLAVMGTRGPRKGWRSYGNGIVAMSGLADRTGFDGRDPIGLGTLHSDFTVPLMGAIHILAALHHRDRTGQGQSLELSQYEASIHLLDTDLVEHCNNGSAPARRGNASNRFVPHSVYPCAGDDRWLAIACRHDDDWRRLCTVDGLQDLARIDDRHAHSAAVDDALAAWTATRDKWAAAAELQAAGVPAAPVEDLDDLFQHDPAMRDDWREIPLNDALTAMIVHEPITWDGERLPIVRAPRWNEHTEDILRELGFDSDTMAELALANALF